MEKNLCSYETEQIVIEICRSEKHVVEYEEEPQGVNKGTKKHDETKRGRKQTKNKRKTKK